VKKLEPQWPYVDYEYREADENAINIEYVIKILNEGSTAGVRVDLAKHIEEFGVYVQEYENRIQRYRNTLEMAYEFMFIGQFKAKTPQKTIKRFKNAIDRVKETVRRNKNDRQ
tara:strand:+ start:518 stop:856 length:339 start_codon:yes stop_codon:yes gene_type:complete